MARLTTIGELVASIAHEINQPLTAVAVQGRTGLNWLGHKTPNIDEARKALELIDRDVRACRGRYPKPPRDGDEIRLDARLVRYQ